jgi:drug/metabolite transporter (DMT)-like permease
MAAGFGRLLIGNRPGSLMIGALLLGAFGALWVIFRADLAALLAFDLGRGETIFFFGAIAHAAVPAITRRIAPNATSFEATFGSALGALIVTVLYAAPATIETDFTQLPLRVWLVALYLGIVTTAGTFFLLQVAIARLSPGKVMAYTYLVPSWVVLHGLVQGNQESALIYIGIATTLAALIILLIQDVDSSG